MSSQQNFKPNTVYVIYIAATPETVWTALISAEFSKQYFFGHTVEVEPRVGGAFVMHAPDGRVHMKGKVMEYDPPRRLSMTWGIESIEMMRKLPEYLVTYQIDAVGDAVRLTMTESHQWDIPDEILSGGRQGWPAILSSLKSLLETGRPMVIKMEPPQEMLNAIRRLG